MSFRYDTVDSPLYSLEDVVRHRMKYASKDDPHEFTEEVFRESVAKSRFAFPRWRKIKFKVSNFKSPLSFLGEEDPLIAKYARMRREGSPFPAIILVPGKPWPIDGNHRLRAAQIVGDEEIDAFVPVPGADD